MYSITFLFSATPRETIISTPTPSGRDARSPSCRPPPAVVSAEYAAALGAKEGGWRSSREGAADAAYLDEDAAGVVMAVDEDTAANSSFADARGCSDGG